MPDLSATMAPTFFSSPQAFRQWFEAHAHTAHALLVGFHKVGSGKPCMSWSESVDEALCFGWIDGVRKRVDDATYTIRFTPRKASSIWSAINIAKVAQLQAEGRMTAAGAEAFAKRTAAKSAVYSHEQASVAELSEPEASAFKRNKTAWHFFEATPPSYKKRLLHWVCTAKRPETRSARLMTLVDACAAGLRLR